MCEFPVIVNFFLCNGTVHYIQTRLYKAICTQSCWCVTDKAFSLADFQHFIKNWLLLKICKFVLHGHSFVLCHIHDHHRGLPPLTTSWTWSFYCFFFYFLHVQGCCNFLSALWMKMNSEPLMNLTRQLQIITCFSSKTNSLAPLMNIVRTAVFLRISCSVRCSDGN